MDRPVSFVASDLACVRGGRAVFAGVSFQVPPGGVLILRGPNGAGKTSLLRLAAGFLAPASGSFAWSDGPIEPDAHRARVTWAGHLDAVKPAFTVAENLSFWIAVGGATTGTGAALASVGMGALADLPAAYLSAGQRHRLNLARLAASDAPLWLLDEPTAALDDSSVASLLGLIAAHQQRGGLAVIASHVELALDNIASLDLGRHAAR